MNIWDFYFIMEHYIRFSLISTMDQRQPNRPQKDCKSQESNQKPTATQEIGFLTYSYYLNCLSSQLLHLSNYLNLQLIKNQSLIDVVTAESHSSSIPKNKGSKSEDNSTASNLDSKYMTIIFPGKAKIQKSSTRKRKYKDSSEADSYQPQSDVEEKWSYYNTNSSKKIASNYCKAIFDFMQSEPLFVSRLLHSLGLEQNLFRASLEKYRGKVNSLVQFHSLWSEHSSNISKAFRIISMQYSRKHRLAHIFAAKGNNYCKHIRYRYKIMETLKKPYIEEGETPFLGRRRSE